ncbi:hypothetical protein [Bacillus cereus group sp. BfR-BA-01380]|uniref:hypothetical protein n=1 Tax=Bacillus cereus group sp. BfR-BA-01380 TaxID=2920324 RepID=UPI001F568C58|nr:hypothetical protein [Bacillus cereus group sp. BfR-BA-01380]
MNKKYSNRYNKVHTKIMVVFGGIDQKTAIHHIDFHTIDLLVGMMISIIPH